LLAEYKFISHQRKKVNFFDKLICITSINTKSKKNIRILLFQNGFKRQEKQENTNWKIYNSASSKEKLCLLKEIDGTECTFHISRLDRAEMHLKKHGKEIKKESVGIITALMNKMELQEKNNKLSSKRKKVKKGKFSFSNITVLIKYIRNLELEEQNKGCT
jgi:cell division protein ZapA (FtsZ GTPase activity inhibitor)